MPLRLTTREQVDAGYLQLCLESPTEACSIVCDAKEDILSIEWTCTLQESRSHFSLSLGYRWDDVKLEYPMPGMKLLSEKGVWGTRLMQDLGGDIIIATEPTKF